MGRTRTTTTPASRQHTETLDTQGRLSSLAVPGLDTVQLSYDTRGRISQVTQGTRTWTLAYDTAGRLSSVTDPLSRTTSYTYDAAHRLTQQTLPDMRVVQFAYDGNDNLTGITPPGRPQHAFAFTAADQLQSYTPPAPSMGTWNTQYTYNTDRQVTQISRPDGNNITIAYDTAGRRSTMTIPGGSLTYAYDATKGTLNTITAPDGGTVQYAYDGKLVTDVSWTGATTGSIHWNYDNNFRVTSESINGGNSASFTYDSEGLLTGAGAMTLSRSSQHGLLTGTTLGVVSDTLTWSAFAELSSYQATVSGTTQFSASYTRDAGGRITSKTETVLGTSNTYEYTYDTAGRLTQVKKDGTVVSTYTYDSNSNRLSYTPQGGSATNGTYDNQDRLTQYGSKTYSYTANGELSQKVDGSQTTTYSYDVLGNLKTVTLPSGTSITYIIDGRNRRVGKKVNGTQVQGFLYADQLRVVAELDGSNALVSRFVYGEKTNVPEYMVKSGTTYRIISDPLGSVRLVINTATGAVAQRMEYDEYGNVTTDTSPGFQPFGFAGGIYDRDTKLVRFGARDYDPEVGRWTAKDPIRFEGDDTNLYGYVLMDPVNLTDPSGLKPPPWEGLKPPPKCPRRQPSCTIPDDQLDPELRPKSRPNNPDQIPRDGFGRPKDGSIPYNGR
jgi:RHS repeat-associated protein